MTVSIKKPASRYNRDTVIGNRSRSLNRWERSGGHYLYPLSNPEQPNLTEILVTLFVAIFYLLWALVFITSVTYLIVFTWDALR